jgi:styrene monooxygenase
MAQGANAASYSAEVVGDAILTDGAFDEYFCQRLARAREEVTIAASDWTNLMLSDPLPQHIVTTLSAMSRRPAMANEFSDNLAHPDRQWRLFATPDRAAAFVVRHEHSPNGADQAGKAID